MSHFPLPEIDWSQTNVKLHDASVKYIGGLSPELEWKHRGISLNETEKLSDNEINEAIQNSLAHLQSDEGKKQLEEFTSEVQFVCSSLIKDLNAGTNSFAYDYVGQKEFIFIIGEMRSGGTYLLKESCALCDTPIESLSRGMMHDSLPLYDYVIGHQDVSNRILFLYEIAQFLVWAKTTFQNSPRVIQKRTGYAFCLPLLDLIFGEHATHILHIRHPGPSTDSIIKVFNLTPDNPGIAIWRIITQRYSNLTQEQWDKLSWNQRLFLFWQCYQIQAAMNTPQKGKMLPLAFGSAHENYLHTLATELQKDPTQINKLTASEKPYSPQWPQQAITNQIFDSVKNAWQQKGLEFPDLKVW